MNLPHVADTDRFGALLAQALVEQRDEIAQRGFYLALSGDLGAGKTALIRSTLRALGVTGPVKSPTFTLLEPYLLLEPYVVSSLNFYHFDFYRFKEPEEFTSAGFREYFGPGSICAVEWPERARGLLPEADLALALAVVGEGRALEASAATELGATCLASLMKRWATAAAGDC